MITRTLKLRLSNKQKAMLDTWLWCLTGVYNFGIRKIELDARDRIYHTQMSFQNLLAGHGEKIGMPSHVIQGTLLQAYAAWRRCFRGLSKKPHLKGQRNKFSSIPLPDPFRVPKNNRIAVPGIGRILYHKQQLPEAKIKCGRLVKRASGWYLCLILDCDHKFFVKETDMAIGIDPGFHSLFTFSDGTKIDNPRELRKGSDRLAQAQRGRNRRLVSRLRERQANRRADRNHKISRRIIENYSIIYYSADNFKAMSRLFGRSVAEAGLGQLTSMLRYKGRTGGRRVIPVNSQYTTMTCGSCGARTGPRGIQGLVEREWDCACGAHHDRDVNAARNVLFFGAGAAHEVRHAVA